MSDQAEAIASLDGVPFEMEQQGDPAPAAPEAVSAPVEGQASPFHTYKWDDGKEDVFNNPDELNRFIKEGALRHSDYTRKTQQIAESRKMLEQRMKDYENKERAFNESAPEIMKMDQWLKANPQVRDRIAEEMRGSTANPEFKKLLEEAINPLNEKLSKYEEAEAKRREDAERNRAFDSVAGRYSDFDRSRIEQTIQRLQEVPPEMSLESLVETLYYAEKGRTTPGAVERKQAQQASKLRPSSPNTATISAPATAPQNAKEQREYAEKVLAQMTGNEE